MLAHHSTAAFTSQPLAIASLHRLRLKPPLMAREQSPSPTKLKPKPKPKRRSGAKSTTSRNRSTTKTSSGKQQQQRQHSQKQSISIHDAKTMGEAIQLAQTISDYLTCAEKFVWLPTDDNLQPHLRTQLIHHEKRRRWGSQLLEGLGQAALSSWEEQPEQMLQQLLEGNERNVWTDARLVRAIQSVALPMEVNGNEEEVNRPEKEGVWIIAALKGLHALAGCIAPVAPSPSASSSEMQSWADLHRGISILIQSADRLSQRTSLKDAVEVRWAIQGLAVRLQMANRGLLAADMSEEEPMNSNGRSVLDFTTPMLNDRTADLPFDIFSHCLSWQMSSQSSNDNYFGYPSKGLTPSLLQSIPFNFDTLTTRTGNSVIERRGTAWLAEEGIGALAYSGKLMPPVEVPEVVRAIMRELEQWCVDQGQSNSSSQTMRVPSDDPLQNSFVEIKWDNCASSLPHGELGQFLVSQELPTFFDCALCNHYPDGDSACKFHTDPEHGTHWHRTTAVVSCGSSRTFAFRPIPEVSTWSEWDTLDHRLGLKEGQQSENSAAALQLFPGDVVFMTGACNDDFHHAVYSSPFDKFGARNSRVSLVFKKALDRGGGKKGHGLAGEGRRSRQRTRRQ